MIQQNNSVIFFESDLLNHKAFEDVEVYDFKEGTDDLHFKSSNIIYVENSGRMKILKRKYRDGEIFDVAVRLENSNEASFPVLETDLKGNPHYQHCGLTKLEYFAGLAAQGISANPVTVEWDEERIAKFSVGLAKELLKQLEA